MSREVERIVARLTEEGEKTRDFFGALSPRDLDQQVYTDGGAWKVKDLLAHLVSSEATVLHTLKDILSGGPGLPDDFDLNTFNETEAARRSQVSLGALLDGFSRDRKALVQLVESLTEPDLGRRGRHPWLGWTTLGEMLQLVYRHPMLHMRDARRALNSGNPVPSGGATARAPVGIEQDSSRTEALILFVKTCHAQSWPRLQRLAGDHSEVMVYPGDPSWRIREVLAHLADAEAGILGQARRVARGEAALPDGFDLARWNRRAVEKKAASPPEENLHEIEAGFHRWIDFVASLDDERLDARGINAEGIPLTVEEFARQAAQHRLDHACDMDQAARSSV
ncbi:MAG: DinB family protein [Anaerolineales bacterium]|jgi:hypothetical protein